MAKKKSKAKTGRKIPKHVAGIKLPKELRQIGETLIAKASSPQGQAAIAQGLTLAAGLATMAADRSRRAEAARPGGEAPTGPSAPGVGGTQPIDPAKVVSTVQTVADEVIGRLFGGRKA